MFPFVYGFEWNTGTLIFLGAFFTVLGIVATTVLTALFRGVRNVRSGATDAIRWRELFHDLPLSAKSCRHHMLGTAAGRVCDNEFACATCPEHHAFRARETERRLSISDSFNPIYGFFLPNDRYYHRGHTWVQVERDGAYRIGVDDFARRMYSTAPEVRLPDVGSRMKKNGVAFTVLQHGSEVQFSSPVEGTVVERGDFWDGWLLRVRPDGAPETEHLLRGDEVPGWIRSEFDRLHPLVSSGMAGVTLADGGTPVENFVDACPQADWDAVRGMMVLDV